MKKHLSMLMLLAALIVPWMSSAQTLASYGFTSGVDSTKWVEMTGATQILTPSNSDGMASSLQNIGFSFPFGATTYTQYSVNTDGNLRLGSTVTGTSNYTTPFNSTNANSNNPKINAFGCDGYGVSGSHYVKALNTTDDNGDTLLAVEFCMGTYSSNTRDYLYKWQVHLYANGNIDIVFPSATGLPSTAPAVAHQCGICASSSDGWVISSSTNTAQHFTSGSTVTNSSGTWFDANRYYSFVHPNNISCPAPTGLTVSNITTDSATFSWTAGGSETEWELAVGDDIYTTTTNSYTVANLEGNTPYVASVRAICGAGDTSFAFSTSFRTACVAISQLPYVNDFENEPAYSSAAYADAFPFCWTRINDATGTNYYPYLNANSTYAHSGGIGMYWYHTTTTTYANNEYAVLPPVDLDFYTMSDLTLAFYAKTTGTSYHPQPIVGVMTDPTDATTFTPIYTFTATEITTSWELFHVSLASYTGDGAYIAIKWPRTSSTCYLAIDDIFLTDEWCDAPTDVMASSGVDELTISWNANGGSSFTVFIGTDTVSNVTDTFYTFTGLTPNTLYSYGVARECSDGNSMFIGGSINTQCVALTTLPYTQDFENAAIGSATSEVFVDCMTRLNNGSQNFGYPYVSATSSYNHTPNGTRGLYWYNTTTTGTYGDYQCVVLPAVDTDMYAINTLQLRFWARATGTSYNPVFQVGVMSNPNDINSFQLVQTVNVGANTTYREFTVALGNFEGYGQYVAIKAVRPTTSWYATVDDITIEPMPTCPGITDLEAVTTVGSALLTWGYQDGYSEPDGYEVTYDSIGGTNATVVTPTEPSVMLTGLAANTTYKVYVQADCGGDGMGLLDSIVFTTASFGCAVPDPATTATIQIGNGTTTTYYVPIGNYYHYSYTQQLITADELNGPTTITSIEFQYAYGTAMSSKTNVTIYLANVSTSSLESGFVPYNASTFVPVYTGNLNCTQGWNNFQFTTPFQYDGTNLLVVIHDNSNAYNGTSYVFNGHSATGKARYVQNDSSPYTISSVSGGTLYSTRANMKIHTLGCLEYATCAAPAVTTTYVGADTVALAWVPGYNETEWDVDYREQGTTAWTTVATGVTATSYIIDGLNTATGYEFRVSFECADDNQLYAGTVEATTICLPVALPYSENFDNITTSTSTTNYGLMPNCWDYTMTGSSTYQTGSYLPRVYYSTSTNYVHSGAYCLYLYGVGIFELPEMPTSLDSLTISFYDYVSSTSYGLIVGAMENGVFVPIDTADLVVSTPTLVEFNLSSYHGTSRKIALRNYYTTSSSTYYSYNYIDNIYVDYTPTCPHVTHIELDSVSESSVSLSWTAGGNETEWSVVYDDNYTTTFTPSITITGLEPNTPYTVEVRALCDESDSSTAMEFNVRTLCEPYLPLPYIENFDGYTTSTTAVTGVQVPCWGRLMTGTSTYQTGNYLPMVYYSTSYAHSGNYCMRLYGVGYHSLPQLPVAASLTTIGFWATSTSSSYKCYFGVMSDPDVASTFDTIQELTFASYSTPQYFEIDLANYTGTGRYLAFRNVYTSTTTYYSYIYLDDVEVWQTTNCPAPVVNVSEVEPTSITVTWFDTTGNSHNGATIYWSLDENINHAQSVVVPTGNSYTITGLTPSTDYYLWISGNCVSENSRPMLIEVTTASACAPVENLTMNGADGNSLGISWNAPSVGNAATSYIVSLRKCTNIPWNADVTVFTDTVTTTNYLFTGLDEATTYAAVVTTVCNNTVGEENMVYATTTICEMDTVGDYSTNYSAQPIYATQPYAYTQQIYLASELEGIDSISSIAIYQNGYAYNDRNITVYLGYTSKNEFATTTDAVPFSHLTQVYSGRLSGYGWLSLDLDSTYVRNTDSNLVVAIDDNTGTAFGSNCYWACTNFGSIYRAIRYYGANDVMPSSPSGTSARDYYRAYIVFGNAACELSGCNEPIVMQTASTADRVDIAWNALDGTAYTVEYRIAGTNDWNTVSTANTTGIDSIMGLGASFLGEVRVSYECEGNTVSGTATISTLCGVAALPLAEDFEQSNFGNYQRACWISGSTYLGETNPLPRITRLTGSEDRICHFQNGAYLILPEVAEDLDSLQIRFKLTQGNDDASLLLGLMTDASMPIYTMHVLDTLNRYEVDSTTAEVTIVYQFGQLDSAYHHARIAFWDAFGSYSFLNDIVVEYVPQCTPASEFNVDTVTTTSATISWLIDGENATSYIVEYGPRYYTPGTGTTVTGTSSPITINGLAHSTSYDAYVYTVCGASNDISIASQVIRFETECDIVTTLPYGTNFENIVPPGSSPADALPNCWTSVANGAMPHIIYTSTSSYLGSGSYCFSFTSLGTAALPQMSMPINTVMVSFREFTPNPLTDGIIVGTVDANAADMEASFVPYDTIDIASNGDATAAACYFNEYTGTGNRIAIRNFSRSNGTSSTHYIDDLVVEPLPACVPPQHVRVEYALADEAYIVWSRGNSATYDVIYNEHGDSVTSSVPTSSREILLTGLTPETQYDVKIVDGCGDTVALTFTTACAITLPYVENFDSYTTSTTAATGVSVPCWNSIMTGAASYQTATYMPQVYYSSTYANSGNYSLRLYGIGYHMLPSMPTSLDSLQMVFFPHRTSTSYNLEVGVVEGNIFIPVDTVNIAINTHPEILVKFNNYHGNSRRIAFKNIYGTNGYSYYYIDDIEVDYIPTCPKVDSLHADAVLNNSADISWVSNGTESEWEVTCGGVSTIVYSTSTTITGLAPDSDYVVTVRPICSAGDTGRVRTIAIHTTCNPVSLPYTENFDSIITATSNTSDNYGVVPNCWNYIMTGTTTYQTGSYLPKVYYSTSYSNSGNYCLYLYGVSYTMLPPMPTSLDSLEMTFSRYITSASYGLEVGVMEGETFVPVETITNPISTHSTHTVYFATYTGNSRTIAFRNYYTTSSTNYTAGNYIDDIDIHYIPTCAHVMDIVADSTSTNSITIDWTDVTPAIGYEVEYGVAGFAQGTGTIHTCTTHPTTISGLNAATSYNFYVRPICTVGDTAEWYGPLTVATECVPITLPYTQNFDAVPGTTYSTEGQLPACWDAYTNGTTVGYTPHVVSSGSYWYADSANALCMTSGSTATYGNIKVVALPPFANPLNTTTIAFWMSTESQTNGCLHVGYLTGPNLTTDFVTVDSIPASAATYHGTSSGESALGIRDTVSFANIPATAQRLAFKWYFNSTFYSCCIDDVSVWADESCPAPVVTVSNVDYQSATITASGNNGNSYELNYGTDPSTYGTTLTSTTGTFNLTNLTPATQYFYRVMQYCDDNEVSVWTEGYFITDSLPCLPVTGLAVSGTSYNSVTLTWTAVGTETAWEVKVYSTVDSVLATVQTDSATVDGLVPQRAYNVIVRPLCGSNANIEGPWSDTVQFSTNACLPVSDVVVSDITATSASVAWTATDGSTNFRVAYGYHNFSQGEELGIFNTATNPYALTDLEPATEYTVQVATVCTEGLVSAYVSADFTTANEEQGIDGTVLDNAISLYPNPASTMVTLRVGEQMVGSTVSIVDVNGREAMSETLASETLTIDLSQLAKGAYFVRLTGEQATVVRKLIVK